jgi:hypothetical protein
MPDLHDLDTFDQGMPPMDVLPPSEIRRRGDRVRRRRTALVATGGVLAVALAIGIPAVARSGHDDGHDIQPAPSPSPTATTVPSAPSNGWLQSVFDFPIDSGFPKPFQKTQDVDTSLVQACDNVALPGGPYVDEVVLGYRGESEDRAQRWLIVYPDQRGAELEMLEVRTSVHSCLSEATSSSHGMTPVYDEVPVELGTEDSFAWTEQIQHDDGLLSDLTYVQVARTGNALYVESTYTSAGGNEVVEQVQQLLTRRSAEPLGLLCMYAVDPCLDPFAPPGEPETVSPATFQN